MRRWLRFAKVAKKLHGEIEAALVKVKEGGE